MCNVSKVNANGKVIYIVGSHNYSFYEVSYKNKNRGVKVVIENVGRINNSAVYALNKDSNPHKRGVNKYLKNYKTFYENLGIAIAKVLESSPRDWEHNITWPQSVTYNDFTVELDKKYR